MARSEILNLLLTLDRGEPVVVDAVGGGCIASAAIARFADGTEVFVKTVSGGTGMFEAEAAGLRELDAAGAIRVPRVLAVDSAGLVLECIREGRRPPGFFESFGRALAALHLHRAPVCGFHQDNYIGATPQPNAPLVQGEGDAGDGRDWPSFYLERRLRFQCDLAAGRGADELMGLLDQAEPRIRDLLESAIEPPVLLHGDLWGGNFLVDEAGEPVLIDPAVYYGHREAELAMTRLFGGFDPQFYAGYAEASPLIAGHEERLPLYQLYHVINHFNLFGGGYGDQARRILQSYR
ncbi:fructosamine kinase family protein [Elongatibacter sediminis]|uniref:Fructosamine kinase family protein n=1 Tax=Elongatibacter sediminis TaxID=3119006 RepID=A0AAW9RC21_9GAMM